MKTVITMLIAVLGMVFLADGVHADAPLTVGEKWVYEHDGRRPWGRDSEDVEGDRVREVIKTEKEGDQEFWIVKESYGSYDDNPSREYVDSKKMIVKRSGRGDTFIHYIPGRPADHSSLKPGEEKVYDVETRWGDSDRGATLKIAAKRLENETLTVPAGEFKNCQHTVANWTLSFSGDQGTFSMKLKIDYWHHPDVNGSVKEAYAFDSMQFGDQTREGYTCTSELKSYSQGDAE